MDRSTSIVGCQTMHYTMTLVGEWVIELGSEWVIERANEQRREQANERVEVWITSQLQHLLNYRAGEVEFIEIGNEILKIKLQSSTTLAATHKIFETTEEGIRSAHCASQSFFFSLILLLSIRYSLSVSFFSPLSFFFLFFVFFFLFVFFSLYY